MTEDLDRQMADLQPGAHLGLIFKDRAEQAAAVMPFVHHGLVRGERCLYVADDLRPPEVVAMLAGAGLDVTAAMERGALAVEQPRATYLRDGQIVPDALLHFVTAEAAAATASGFAGLRFIAELTWALGPVCDSLIPFEAWMTVHATTSRVTVLCQYHRRRFDAACLRDVLRTHPLVVLGDLACPNPYFEPPDFVLDAPTDEARVEWMLRQIRDGREKDRELAHLYQALAERERALRELVRRLLVSQDEERRRLAYDVHDGAAQVAAGAHRHLQAFAEFYHPRSPRARRELDDAVDLSQRTVAELRRLISGLRPALLDDLGLLAAVQAEAEALRRDGWDVAYVDALGPERLSPEGESALFRIVQEALANVRKHTQPGRVRVGLERDREHVRLEVRDWGAGFDPATPTSGGRGTAEHIGLTSMRERVALLGGQLVLHSRPGEGTGITVTVPLASVAATRGSDGRRGTRPTP